MDPQYIIGGLAFVVTSLSGVIVRIAVAHYTEMRTDRNYWRDRALRQTRSGRREARKFVDGRKISEAGEGV